MSGAPPASRTRARSFEAALRRFVRPLLWVVVLAPAIWGVYALFTGGLGANPIEELEHYTGEWTLRLLAGTLAITPLVRLTGWGWLVPQRRFLGLAAFFWALGHFMVYAGVDMFFDIGDIVEDVVERLYITIGMLALLLLVPLALTSTKASIRRMGGRNWNRLHRLVYVSAIAGCIHYLWAVKKDTTEPIFYIAIFAVLLGSRLVMRRPLRRRAVETTPAESVTPPSAA